MKIALLIPVVVLIAAFPARSERRFENREAGKELVRVSYALDDKRPTESFHNVLYLHLTENGLVTSVSTYDWGGKGGFESDPDAQKKAAKCIEMLSRLPQPADLPADPNLQLDIKWWKGDEMSERKFSVKAVPEEVRGILQMMDRRDGMSRSNEWQRFSFVQTMNSTNAVERIDKKK